MPGDYIHKQAQNTGFSYDIDLDGAAVAATAIRTVKSANHRIYVQRVTLNIKTHANAKVFSVEDSAGTPLNVAYHTDLTFAAGVPSVVEWDFGPNGRALTIGKNLNYLANTAGSGFVGNFHVEGYEKLDATVAAASTN